jgi:hypothetical protein
MGVDRLDSDTLALYLSGRYDVHARLRVENGSGTLVDMQGRWISIQREFPNPDAPIGSLSVDLLRETDYEGSDSLAPMVQVSTWNRLNDGVTYSPLLITGRELRLSVALTAERGARPANNSALWYEVFRGHIAKVPGPRRDSHVISIRCNEYPGQLKVAKSETAYTYAAGIAVEAAIRQVLNNNGFTLLGMYTPVPSGKVLSTTYAPGRQKAVWDQVHELAQSIGWVLWPTYRAATNQTPSLTFFAPARDKTTPTLALADIAFRDFEQFEMDEEALRNVGYGQFTNLAGIREEVGPVVDSDSIARYGGVRRPFWISFAADSPVRKSADMMAVLEDAVSDSADPDVLATALVPAMPFVECASDLYTFPADARFFDTPQNYAPYAASFSLRADAPHSGQISLRGKPSAGYRTWRRFFSTSPIVDDPTLSDIYDVRLSDQNADGSALMTFKRGPGTYMVRGGARVFPLPRNDQTNVTLLLKDSDRMAVLSTDQLYVPAAPAGHYAMAAVHAYDAQFNPGEIAFVVNAERYATPAELAVVEQAAADATLAAAGAQAAADGKITTYFQPGQPTAEAVGDLWMDTDAGNKLYRWSGSTWVQVQDQAIVDAIAAAAEAQETADGKIVSFYQATTPTADGVGDLWTDTDDQNHLHRWNGSAWVSIRDGRIAIAQQTAEGAMDAADAAASAAAEAAAIADGKIDSYLQPTPPTGGKVGDFWVDSNDGNRLYRHNGTGWEESDDERIVQALIDAAGAQATADGKVTTFYSASPPTATATGDLWSDTDDNNHLYRWSGAAWVSIKPRLVGVRIASMAPDGSGGDVTVTVNVEENVATGLGGVQWRVDAGAWTNAVVGTGRSAVFDVDQTTSARALEVRGFRVIGDTSTVGQTEKATIPAYVGPPPGTAPPNVVGVNVVLQSTGSCESSQPLIFRVTPTFFGVTAGYHWAFDYSEQVSGVTSTPTFGTAADNLPFSTTYYDLSLPARVVAGGVGTAYDLGFRARVVHTASGNTASKDTFTMTETIDTCAL